MHSRSFTLFSNEKTKMPNNDEIYGIFNIVRSCAVEYLQILLYLYLNNGFYNALFNMAQYCRIT